MSMVVCETCGKEFVSIMSMRLHYRKNETCLQALKEKQKLARDAKPKVSCMVCGKLMGSITNTHLRSHNMTAADYSAQYPGAPKYADGLVDLQKERRMKTMSERFPSNAHHNSMPSKIKKHGSRDAVIKRCSEASKHFWATTDIHKSFGGKIRSFHKALKENPEKYKAFLHVKNAKRKATSIERYGVEHVFQNPEIQNRAKATWIATYGSLEATYAQRSRTKLKNLLSAGEELVYPNYNRKSIRLFKILDRILRRFKYTIYYATKRNDDGSRRGEYRVQVEGRSTGYQGSVFRFLDFYVQETNKIIEFDESRHNKEQDLLREHQILRTIPSATFLRITEEEYLADIKGTVKKCLAYLLHKETT